MLSLPPLGSSGDSALACLLPSGDYPLKHGTNKPGQSVTGSICMRVVEDFEAEEVTLTISQQDSP